MPLRLAEEGGGGCKGAQISDMGGRPADVCPHALATNLYIGKMKIQAQRTYGNARIVPVKLRSRSCSRLYWRW